MCAVCLEDVQEPAQRGSASCNHYFHEACVTVWLAEEKSCPVCRRAPDKEIDVSDTAEAVTPPPQPPSRLSWMWTLLLALPWPTAQTAPDPTWDASHGVGDWRARMQRIYDAEAAAEEEDDDDSEPDDDGEEEEQDEREVVVPAGRAAATREGPSG